MARILFLAHRLPFPPNKGDKIHSFHVLQQLAREHEVMLGTFIDTSEDEGYVQQVRAYCADLKVSRIRRTQAKVRSLAGLACGEPLSQRFYRDEPMRQWVLGLRAANKVDLVFFYSSTMAQYARGFDVPVFADLGDIDSSKWAGFAKSLWWPLSWVYAREARTLHHVERQSARRAQRTYFATEQEAAEFRAAVPDCANAVSVLSNGVDAHYFDPGHKLDNPIAQDEQALVFTGAMNYWPNVDAVQWFAREVLPLVRQHHPRARLYIVGRNPSAGVKALAGAGVVVTGEVEDVRPYLRHSRVVVAPLRVGRGLPNKVLEGMAMQRPVVTTSISANSIHAQDGVHVLCADSPQALAQACCQLLQDPAMAERMGHAGRQEVLRQHTWPRRLEVLSQHIALALSRAQGGTANRSEFAGAEPMGLQAALGRIPAEMRVA